MTVVALGKQILGAIVAIAGVEVVLNRHHGAEDPIVGGLMFAAGAALFMWGFRRPLK